MLPTQKFVNSLCDSQHTVLLHSGVRASESEERANLPMRGFDGYFAREVFRPLLFWSLEEVWVMHRKYNIPRNPLYDLGFKRVGCFPCMNSCKHEVALIDKYFPERIDKLRAEERSFDSTTNAISTFFARKTVPECQRSVQIVTSKGEQMNVPSIDDVVRWSKTERGGKQYSLSLEWFDDLSEDDAAISCPSQLGHCE